MNPNKKVFITFLAFLLAMLVIACMCVPIIPTPSPITGEPMPGLTGQWHDPDTSDTFVIAWQDGVYVVTSVTWQEDSYSITSQSWTGSSLTWSYYDTTISLTVTHTTTSLSGDSLSANWSYSDGRSGTETLLRGAASPVTPQANILASPDSLELTSAQAGLVTSAVGATMMIPAGAVPLSTDGNIGTMIFSINEDTTITPSLPEGLVPVGPVVNLGPEGFVFALPVTLSLPIPPGTDLSTVLGAAYLDPEQGTWQTVPASVDETSNTVEVRTTHLSHWTTYGLDVTFGPFVQDVRDNGGWFKVIRPSDFGFYTGPDARLRNSPVQTNGICLLNMVWNNPDSTVSNWWTPPTRWVILAETLAQWGGDFNLAPRSDYAKYWMPTGTYTLAQVFGQSEVNPGDPLYIPKYWNAWRILPPFVLGADQTIEFPVPDLEYSRIAADGWTEGYPPGPCYPDMTNAVGVGNLQVTLNWNSHADLDLQVIEPDGTVIDYLTSPSATGGALDQDNQCNDEFVMGRPENIFWTTPPTGTYQVNVNYYADCGDAGPVNFTIRICKNGICDNPISSVVNTEYDTVSVTSFTFP